MSARFTPAINRLRATLRGKHGPELMAALDAGLAALPVPTLAADNSARYIACNALACELLGYRVEELTRMTVLDLTPRPQNASAHQLWETFIAQGTQRGEFEIARKNGTTMMVRYMAWASIVPGVHVSLLTPLVTAAERDGEPSAARGGR